MNSIERRAALSLALIYATRMLGLFMILPVFALYAENLVAVTPLMIGLAIGIYGLTQALLQIPFGMLSDRFGRKPIIIFGLLLFALGSVLAAVSDSIYGVILGRALQGSGAIAAAVMALAADLTREQHRTKVMAIIGASIGAAFMLALVLGPLIDGWIGVPGIFWMTALLAGLAILVITFLIPTPQQAASNTSASVQKSDFWSVLTNGQLLRLDFGIFALHMVLTAIFVVMPVLLRDQYSIDPADHWQVYLGVLVISLMLMAPSIVVSERLRATKVFFLCAIALCGLSQFGLNNLPNNTMVFLGLLVLYFWGFNFLEASLPSMVSKISHAQNRGASMGVYSSSQFMGAFVGGVVAGLLIEKFSVEAVFMFAFVMFLIWFLVALGMQAPTHFESYTVELGRVDRMQAPAVARSLQALPGVAEATVIAEEGVAYLRIDSAKFEEQQLKKTLC